MKTAVFATKEQLGQQAARDGAAAIRDAVSQTGAATIVLATGASQFETLNHLVTEPDVPWDKVHTFHLDEYVGIPDEHPASFRRYLRERFAEKVPALGSFTYVAGDARNLQAEIRRLNAAIAIQDIAVAFIGIGENGHLAFNDPPANFDTTDPFLVVQLDEACRRQQCGEGWFASVAEVPAQAISMSVRQILKARKLIVSVPDQRKARAVHCALEGPVDPMCPASILQDHKDCTLYLDGASAGLLQSRRAGQLPARPAG